MFAEIKEPFRCTPLHIAVIMGHANVCAFLLHHASGMPNFIDRPTDDGDTALHLAVKHNRTHIVKLLLHKNANLACENASTMQPIHFASSRAVLDLRSPPCAGDDRRGDEAAAGRTAIGSEVGFGWPAASA